MKSGWPDDGRDWNQEYYRIGLEQLVDRTLVQRVFSPGAALVAKKPVDGYRVEREYTGGEFDAEEFELVQGRWDHDHCIVCYFRIEPGYTYWQNGDGLIVCDVCYEHVQAEKRKTERLSAQVGRSYGSDRVPLTEIFATKGSEFLQHPLPQEL